MRPSRALPALAASTLIGWPSPAAGQAPELRLAPPPCALTASDSQLVTVYLALIPTNSDSSNAKTRIPVAMALAAHFTQPSELHIHSWPGTYIPGSGTGAGLQNHFGLGGTLHFDLDHKGRLTSRAPLITTDSPDLNAAIAGALQAASTEGAFAPATGGQEFEIVESIAPATDAVAFARIRLRAIPVDGIPRFLSAPPLQYPQVGDRRRVGDRVLFEFIIQEDGSVDRASVRVLRAGYAEFVESALATIRGARFEPGTVHGCPVRTRVTQGVSFRVR